MRLDAIGVGSEATIVASKRPVTRIIGSPYLLTDSLRRQLRFRRRAGGVERCCSSSVSCLLRFLGTRAVIGGGDSAARSNIA